MKKIFLYSLILISFAVRAQEKKEKDTYLPEANAEFAKKNYVDAEANYRISRSNFPKKAVSAYNLGNAIYVQKHADEAGLAYLNAITDAKTRPEKHKAFHNLGNVFMTEKNYTAAVEAYKNALINNPADEQTRYNYALAKKMLKENPPKKDDKKKDKDKDKKKDKNKDKDKDKKDGKDKDKDKKDGKDKDKKDDKGDKDKGQPKDDKGQPKGQPKPKEGGISPQRLQNMLDAVNNEEKKIQEKVNKNKVKGRPVQTEKDW